MKGTSSFEAENEMRNGMGRAKIHLHLLASQRGRLARPLGTTQSVIIVNAVESAPVPALDNQVVTVILMTNLIAMSAIVPATSDTPIQVGHLQPKTSPSDSCLLVIIFR